MKYFRIIQFITAAIGFVLLFCAASTSDFHVIEQGAPEPSFVWTLVKWGAFMMIPSAVYIAVAKVREFFGVDEEW